MHINSLVTKFASAMDEHQGQWCMKRAKNASGKIQISLDSTFAVFVSVQ